ncbi:MULTISPECIES: hypothetical protein [unclassified Beijerinckia]|uniref:hypothetical protein n=1 Tax=unclassified Beijerinckia TaxID=2638183 RepID=UPI001114F6BA|nr:MULTISPECIES: hypothetical protein [unclassified Beijerinckia]
MQPVDRDITRLLVSETLTFEDIKTLMQGCRYYPDDHSKVFEYADTLLPEASDYLQPHTLHALVRADITEMEAALHLEENKVFFHQLANLLPSIASFFSKEARLRNARGLVGAIDSCRNDFKFRATSARRDRQLREAKEKLRRAASLVREAASALDEAEEYFKNDYDRYRSAYYKLEPGPLQFLSDLIDELRVCVGVLDIQHEVADIEPEKLLLFGNDQRRDLVENVYRMCWAWDGPKLVTTPGSDFSALCSLMFEAVSGRSDEGLAGAINRYARSESRKQKDHFEENYDPDDNFQDVKEQMQLSVNTIALCKGILQKPSLSDIALQLLNARIKHEEKSYEEAQAKYGPRQVHIDQMTEEQWNGMLMEAISRWKPEQIDSLFDMIRNGKSTATLDIEHGQTVRAARANGIDIKSEKEEN